MRTQYKLAGSAILAAMSGVALAQPAPDYQVSWVSQSVPISPWVSGVIALLLLLATYAFMRRHAGQGLFMLAATVLIGALSLHTGNPANAIPIIFQPITTQSGSETYSCSGSPYPGYQNATGGPLLLTVTPLNIPNSIPGGSAAPAIVSPICPIGASTLSANATCVMPCAG